MAKTNFQNVDEYLDTLPAETKKALEQVRQAIHDAVPDVEEVISYQIPAFKYHGWVLYMSGYAKHFSLSAPPPFAFFEKFKKELEPYKKSKSTVQFPLDEPVPVDLIKRMAVFQAEQNVRKKD